MEVEITLIRNGGDSLGWEGRLTGQLDEPLCGRGIRELRRRASAGAYPKAQRVYTGSMSRCRESTALIYPMPAVISRGLSAFDYGVFTGKRYDEIKESPEFLHWARQEWAAPIGEGGSPHGCLAGNLIAFDSIVRELEAGGIGRASIVTHRAGILAILNHRLVPCNRYFDGEIAYGGGCTVRYETRHFTMKLVNSF